MRYIKKPDIIDAVRYGDHETGEWDDGALARMVAFYLDLPEGQEPTPEQIEATVVRQGTWNPPEQADMYLGDRDYDYVRLGDWMARDAFGSVQTIMAETFPLLWAQAEAEDQT